MSYTAGTPRGKRIPATEKRSIFFALKGQNQWEPIPEQAFNAGASYCVSDEPPILI